MHRENNKTCKISSMGNTYEFNLTGHIDGPEHYVQDFDILREAGETDVIIIHINSTGGIVSTALQLISIMKESPAHIITSIEGSCCSAATMVFLQGDEFIISKHCTFMIHNYSGGYIGKGNEIHSNSDFMKVWSKDIVESIYDGFLTKEEMLKVIEGSDIYLDAEQVVKRCKVLINHREVLQEIAQENE